MQTSTAKKLSRQTLSQLPTTIAKPDYAIEKVETGIVHIGVGGFHRAHQAMYTDAFMAQTGDLSWGICGVGLREGDRRMQEALASQDHLFTLVEKHADGERSARVIGALTNFMLAVDNPKAVIEQLASPSVKLVSLTITEGGYNMDPSTGEFQSEDAAVQHDLKNPETPKQVFGYLMAGLKLRQERGLAPFTLLSCDNIQHNGSVLKKMLCAYIELADKEFAQWVTENVAFPNSMVDRITPTTTTDDIAQLAECGVDDAWPVVCEPFAQWIIEDSFCHDKPALDKVGAQFVQDVAPYEKLKLRMLNASHSILGLCGSLAGVQTIHECMQLDEFYHLLTVFMESEVAPTLDPVAGIDIKEYQQILLKRFANPNIKDTLTRICSQSSAKIPVFLLPTILDNLKHTGRYHIGAFTIACWYYYSARGCTQAGEPLHIDDSLATELKAGAQRGPEAFLKLTHIFGNLSQFSEFNHVYIDGVNRLQRGESVQSIITELSC
ncbi:mannitol dehydrogenase family protein [Alteromonas lipotrueiana]|uniref:mannitol dehydrogenase family protein n=1 Tax=Alteromonas lipotrueiana TaxID=2803815 RepID=UPI001C496BA8|nr:mannitol dehydrogenase family protein [Alteromonas lipotrueiana]